MPGWKIVGAALATALAVAACDGSLSMPSAPNLDAVVATYENPPGTVDTARVNQMLADAHARMKELHLDWLPPLIVGVVSRLRERMEDNGLPTDPQVAPNSNKKNIDAVAKVTHVCRGFQDPPESPDAEKNGTFELTATIQTGSLERIVWGTAAACRERITVGDRVTVDAQLDGTVILYLYGPLPSTLAEVQLLVRIEKPGATGASGFDFRIVAGTVEFRLPAQDGDIIVAVGSGTLTLRGHNQTAVCDVASATCSPQMGA